MCILHIGSMHKQIIYFMYYKLESDLFVTL